MSFGENDFGPFSFEDEYDEEFDDDVSDEDIDSYDEDSENYEEAFEDEYDIDEPYDDIEAEDGYTGYGARDDYMLSDEEDSFFDDEE